MKLFRIQLKSAKEFYESKKIIQGFFGFRKDKSHIGTFHKKGFYPDRLLIQIQTDSPDLFKAFLIKNEIKYKTK